MIHVKDLKVVRPFFSVLYHEKMWDLFKWISVNFDIDIVITSSYREGDRGVHGTEPCRGLDLRANHLPYTVAIQIAEEINNHWRYDTLRPWYKTCVLHGQGRNIHFHLQVHNRTRLKNSSVAV